MPGFYKLHFIPVYDPDADPPPEPDLEAFEARREKAKATFLRQLVDYADEPFIGMEWNVPELGRIVIQIDLVQHTAALVSIGRLNSQPEGTAVANGQPAPKDAACTMLMAAVLLSGFPDADSAALDLVKTTPGFCNNPNLDVENYERAQDAGRPLMVLTFANQETYLNPHLRTLSEALAEAFFHQFGTLNEGDDDEGNAGGGGPQTQAA